MALPPFVAVVVTTSTHAASARRAVESLFAHHVEAQAVVVLVDDRFGLVGESLAASIASARVDVRGPAWLGTVLGDELHRLAMIHAGHEVAASVRPFALRAVLAERRPRLLLSLPADAEVLGPIDALVGPDGDCALVVVPARLTAPPSDGKLPDVVDIARGGRLDQELFALTGDGRAIVDDWCTRLARSPHIGPDRVPHAHPWLDEIASRSHPRVVVDPSIGVSYRNADEPGRGDDPRLLRFEGFDPSRPWLLSARTAGLPRVLLSEHRWLAAICRARAAGLAGDAPRTDDPRTNDPRTDDPRGGGWDVLATGVTIDPAMRRAYLVGLLDAAAEPSNGEPPDPFAPGGAAAFLRWLAAPPDERRPTSRYLRTLHELRPDLHARFADPDDAGPDGLRAWARINGRGAGIPPELLPPPEPPQNGDGPAITTAPPPNGINVVGFLRAELGVGEAARQLLRSAEASGLPLTTIVDRATLHRQHAEIGGPTATEPAHRVNVLALNADAMLEFARARGSAFFDGRHTAALWFWEVERFPARFDEAFRFVDEVWVATEHVRAAIASATDKPVFIIPLALPAFGPKPFPAGAVPSASPTTPGRSHFTVTFCFDYASVGERKNPAGAIDAYCAAFPEAGVPLPDGRVPRFLLKSINADRHAVEREHVLAAIGERADIVQIEEYLDPSANQALIAESDCYVSLHRAEGWGLTMAEAMAAGVPVVATGYSGNLAFMDESNSWLIPYSLVSIPDHVREYAGCGRWAEPDIAAAAAAIRSIALDPESARARAAVGRATVERLSDPGPAARFIRSRTTALVTRSARPAVESAAPSTPIPTPEEATVDPAPPSSNDDSPATHPVLEHPGLGPVILPPPPAAPPAPAGLKGSIRGQLERAIKFEIDHRDQREHARAAAIVEEVSLTREAVRAVGMQQFADQRALTAALGATADHLQAVQIGHDALHAAVTDIGRSAHDSTVALGDVAARLDRIEARLDQLTTTLEALAARPPAG